MTMKNGQRVEFLTTATHRTIEKPDGHIANSLRVMKGWIGSACPDDYPTLPGHVPVTLWIKGSAFVVSVPEGHIAQFEYLFNPENGDIYAKKFRNSIVLTTEKDEVDRG